MAATYKGECFCGTFTWRRPASRKLWVIVIADRAGPGRAARSMPSRFGGPAPCGSLRARNMLPCSRRQNSVSAGVHVNYAETVLPMRDGLTKLKDFPKEFGGSGEVVPE